MDLLTWLKDIILQLILKTMEKLLCVLSLRYGMKIPGVHKKRTFLGHPVDDESQFTILYN